MSHPDRSHRADPAGTARLQVRIGAAAGEPIERDKISSDRRHLAARLCAYAEPGTVLVTNGIAELCLGKGMQFAAIKRASLKALTRNPHPRGDDHLLTLLLARR